MSKKIKLPKKVRIGYLEYDLHVCDQGILDALHKMDGPPGTTWGRHSFMNTEIAIVNHLKPNQTAGVLLHEIFHACLVGSTLGSQEEEAVVQLLEDKFASFIKDNPAVVKYIVENI